jgi:predicted transcriptional regulator
MLEKVICLRGIISIEAIELFTNHERVMKRFLPAFRLKAAHIMVKDYKITQQQAAVTLGTTQAAISKYLKENSEKYTGIKLDAESLKNFVELVKKKDEQGAQKIMCRLCQVNGKFDCTFMVK